MRSSARGLQLPFPLRYLRPKLSHHTASILSQLRSPGTRTFNSLFDIAQAHETYYLLNKINLHILEITAIILICPTLLDINRFLPDMLPDVFKLLLDDFAFLLAENADRAVSSLRRRRSPGTATGRARPRIFYPPTYPCYQQLDYPSSIVVLYSRDKPMPCACTPEHGISAESHHSQAYAATDC